MCMSSCRADAIDALWSIVLFVFDGHEEALGGSSPITESFSATEE